MAGVVRSSIPVRGRRFMRQSGGRWTACGLLAVAAVVGAWSTMRSGSGLALLGPAGAADSFRRTVVHPPSAGTQADASPDTRLSLPRAERRSQATRDFTLWLDDTPDWLQAARQPTGEASNIHRSDYSGPAACRECHRKQFDSWSGHAHRWMNALATKNTVKGDFGDRKISYLGGEISTTMVGDSYRMRLERGAIRREYLVEQTIGSRFFQYYTGRLLNGPEPNGHPLYRESFVLPIGYWLDRQEWVPTVHVHADRDYLQHDPYAVRPWDPSHPQQFIYESKDLYRSNCNFCHTTFPLGDMLVRFHEVVTLFAPKRMDFSFPAYVQKARPDLWPAGKVAEQVQPPELSTMLQTYRTLDARKHAVTLGISCEACHLGARQHAEGKWKKPLFFPQAPELSVVAPKDGSGNRPADDFGRTHDNINWACGRCHTGKRPQFAAGMATWNSTEYADATRGSCYSQLTCVECHNPHETLGAGWKETPTQDDAHCLKCHQQFAPKAALAAHTHHQAGSEGSRCLNCHMPRINEGLQAVVRTHMIFSPTNAKMIEANHPNACNLCHVEQPIDWTLARLQEWYGATYAPDAIATSYPERQGPVAQGWLHSRNEAVRLVAADALCRANAKWATPELVNMLDDQFVLNRQFTRMGLESMLHVKLKDYGYEFYMQGDERRKPIEKVRAVLLRKSK